jgi:hypothetical protein
MFFTDVSGYVWHRDETKLERISEADPNPEGVATQSASSPGGGIRPI